MPGRLGRATGVEVYLVLEETEHGGEGADQTTKMDKRIRGPDVSVKPFFEERKAQDALLLQQGKRLDSRDLDEARPMCTYLPKKINSKDMTTGIIVQASGSAYIEVGASKVVCAVYGPKQQTKNILHDSAKLFCDFKFAPFALSKRKSYQRDATEVEYSQIMQQALAPSIRLELLPKSTIDVFVTVLQADGQAAALATAITCASLALVDSGIELFDLVAASSAGFVVKDDEETQVRLDCDGREEDLMTMFKTCTLTLAMMPSMNETTHLIQAGEISSTHVTQAIDLTTDACLKIYGLMRQTLNSK